MTIAVISGNLRNTLSWLIREHHVNISEKNNHEGTFPSGEKYVVISRTSQAVGLKPSRIIRGPVGGLSDQVRGTMEAIETELQSRTVCRPIRQGDETYCATCALRWTHDVEDAPPCPR